MEEIFNELLSNVLGNVEVLVFAWGICQVRLTKDWKRWTAAVVLWAVVMAVAYGGFFGEMVYFPIKMVGNMMAISFLLMKGRVVQRIIKYWFSFSYVDIIYQPIHFVIIYWGEFTKSLSWSDRAINNIASSLNICILLLLARQIQKRKQWVSWIQSIPMKS